MRFARIVLLGIALALVAVNGVHAGNINLVTNGDFETTTSGLGQLGYNTNATGWSTSGYNFVFGPKGADSTGVTGQYGNLQLWGPGNGSNNGLTASPTGGNFIAADGAYEVGAITQTINGLTKGESYVVNFNWAGAQQEGVNYTSPTTEQWRVGFGSQHQDTAVLINAGKGFTGWQAESFTFTADGTSDVLSFLAVGTPSGVPPFSLLDGISVNAAVPEPSSLALAALGLLGLGVARFRRQAKSSQV